jgi:outer membrane protein TolC
VTTRAAPLALVLALSALPARILAEDAAPAAGGRTWTLEECVAQAVARSGRVAEARGKVDEWEAKRAEVAAVFSPKLSGFAFGAPVYGVRGTGASEHVRTDWGNWGPYWRFEGMLVQPVYTFGRVSAGEKAAGERVEVERAQLELERQRVALEARRYYHLHLYARSFQPTLRTIRKLLDEAMAKAQQLYDSASGKVTNVDLMKLKYASTELDKYAVQAEAGAAIALAALQHVMGLPAEPPITLAETQLAAPGDAPLPPLETLVGAAVERRPESAQIRHGRLATESLELSESRADYPVLAIVGQLLASRTPNRTDDPNPYHWDPYNDLNGGVALVLRFDLDPAKSRARSAGARALRAQVEGLATYASTGIPVEVRKAYGDATEALKLLALAREGSTATLKWMLFAGAAYASGTGETRDVLEGVAAYGAARKGYFDALLAYHQAVAQLAHVTGGAFEVPVREAGGGAAP